MSRSMDDEERRAFLCEGTRTGALAVTRADGTPHVMPVWFVLDGDDVVFMTGADTIKGRALLRTGYAAMSVDDPSPPYAFVSVGGPVTVTQDLPEMLPWSIRIAGRYMGAELADAYGRRNAVPGELLVRMHPERTVAVADLAD